MKIHILGVPMDLGAGRRGVDMGPSAIRIAGVAERLRSLGHTVIDEGDILVKPPEQQRITNEKLKYLPAIVRACTLLAGRVEKIIASGEFPLVLGGDHSVAIGTIAGLASHCRKSGKTLGVLWIDAHGDLNTDQTSPSGNIHGMPLAASLGLGAIELTSVGGDFPKLDPKNVVLIATRDLDDGERDHIKKFNLNVFTMEEIDKHGMALIATKALRKLRNVDYLHVSLDLDAIDPSVAPGVGTPVKGGLNYREAHLIMETLNEFGKMTSLEVVEVNPILDNRNQSAEFAVELILSGFGKKDPLAMEIITTIAELQRRVDQLRLEGKRIAVVPTMGYLHAGHTSLIRVARAEADVVITTIFVNPTQFGPTEDYTTYPRDLQRDRVLAAEAGTDILFTPSVEEMYPAGFSTSIDMGEIFTVLEGKFRPTHFRGVATVVAKLFNITKPHVAVFGQKDAQQAFIIRKLVKELNFDIEIIIAPIIREPDGLAMSSRNVYLSDDERKRATSLFRALDHVLPRIQEGERNAAVLRSEMEKIILSAQPTSIDYIAFVDPKDFQEMSHLEGGSVYVLLAVRFGKTRLIDNMLIEIPHR